MIQYFTLERQEIKVQNLKYKRVLIKLSGEALAGERDRTGGECFENVETGL